MNELTTLANKYRSDKGDEVGAKHNYTPLYDFIFRNLKSRDIRVLEIGLLRGGPELGNSADRPTSSPPSIQMWLEYFEAAKVIGFDISDFSRFQTERFSFMRGDSGNEENLRELIHQHGPFDIVLDDASHASFHQLKAFELIFPTLPSGGIYIIEDLHWQPKDIEAELPKCPTGRQFLDWAMGHLPDEELVLPPELPFLKSTYPLIGFCHGFAGFRTGSRGVKTSVYFRA